MINEFIVPLDENAKAQYQNDLFYTWGDKVVFYDKTQSCKDFDIALLGIKDVRPGNYDATGEEAPHLIRKALYHLVKNQGQFKIIDLGNIEKGVDIWDTQVALKLVIEELLSCQTIPIILGGAHAFTYGQYLAYEKKKEAVNIVLVDEKLDMMPPQHAIADECFLTDLFLHQPNRLYQFSALAYQSYWVPDEALAAMEKFQFEMLRLGRLREDFNEAEPVFRSADMLSFDMSALKSSEAPGQIFPSPNGLYGEEACQIMQFAGISETISSVGIYNYCPANDWKGQTAQLIAQMIWYFVEGYYHRKNEIPDDENDNFLKFHVLVEEADLNFLFIKSKLSGRWWLLAPTDAPKKVWLPCTFKDYEQALLNEMPLRWNNYLWKS